ncbi:MAG: 4-hydroxy-tetrahydrodipicolinate reductase [Gammaproteobacteria bacterium]|nr:4-hydroxy-tetrahydrodipicolinate reductase [Gammaproteobacteria bacterium]
MAIRVLINGADGKMGQAAVQAISADKQFILAAKTGRQNHLADAIQKNKIDVALDLTEASVAKKNLLTILEAGARPVIGTSGLTQLDVDDIRKQYATQKIGGIIVPNFSLGAVLMMKCAELIAPYFSDVEIIEMHHAGKLDSPSGTAVRTAEILNAGRHHKPSTPPNARELLPGARGATHQAIPIHSIRLPGLIAHQRIIFGGTGEILSIQHDTTDRQCFMPGVLLACKKVMDLDHILYGLENIL